MGSHFKGLFGNGPTLICSTLQLQYKTINFKIGDFGKATKKEGKRRVQDFRLVKSSSRSNFYQKFSAISKVFSSFRVAEDGLKMLTLDYVAVGI